MSEVCRECGSTFTKSTAKFCGKCGTRKAAAAPAPTAPVASASPAQTTSAPAAVTPTPAHTLLSMKNAMTNTTTTTATTAGSSHSNPNNTLRPSSSLHRGPAATDDKVNSPYATVEGARLSLNGRVGLDHAGLSGTTNERRRSSLAHMLAAAAAATTPPAVVSSTVEFKDPLTEYAKGQQEQQQQRGDRAKGETYRRGSATIAPGKPSTQGPSPSSAPPTTTAHTTTAGHAAAKRRSSSAKGVVSRQDDIEVFDVEDDAQEVEGAGALFMPLPAASVALLHAEEQPDDDGEAVLSPDPEQEAQYTAWATLGPDGITPEMLQTSNISELKGWQKGTLIGRGTYGSVYLGLLRDGSFQAVKCVEIGARATAAGTFDVKELVSLSREINMMQRLRHKNLCKFRGVHYNAQETTIGMFMEYIGGGSVSTLVKRFKPLPPQVVRSWTKQLLSGLLYLHSQNIIHRDIKGDNVLVDTSASPASESQIKLVDFGAARRLTDAVSQSRTVIGTPYWMAPEVVDLNGDGGGYSYKADVWSVGCTVAEMLTGKPPWPTRTNAPAAIMMIASAEGMPTEIPKEEATPGCYAFMLACFERDPEKRPTVEDLLEHPWITGAVE